MKSIYQISYESFLIKFEVDHSIMTTEKLEEINNFWGGAKSRVLFSGSVLKAVLLMLSRTCLYLSIEHEIGNKDYIKGLFDWDEGCGIEGWPKLSKESGIDIVAFDELYIDVDDFYFSEIDSD